MQFVIVIHYYIDMKINQNTCINIQLQYKYIILWSIKYTVNRM